MVAMAKLCMGGENQPTQQGFGVLEFGDATRALGSATAGQSLKKHGRSLHGRSSVLLAASVSLAIRNSVRH